MSKERNRKIDYRAKSRSVKKSNPTFPHLTAAAEHLQLDKSHLWRCLTRERRGAKDVETVALYWSFVAGLPSKA